MRRALIIICFLASLLSLIAQEVRQARLLGTESGLGNPYIVAMAQDHRGLIWLATENGLDIFDGQRFTAYYKPTEAQQQGLSGNELNTLLSDPRENIMWVGTQRAGLNAFHYDTGAITTYRHDANHPESLATNDVVKLLPYADGRIVVATYWKGFDMLTPDVGTFEHFNSTTVRGLPAYQTRAAAVVGRKVLLGHQLGGVSVVDLARHEARNFKRQSTAESANDVISMLAVGDRYALVGYTSGLALFDVSAGQFTDIAQGQLAGVAVLDIAPYAKGRYWIATEFDGVYILTLNAAHPSAATLERPVGRGTSLSELGSLSHLTSRAVLQDSYGNSWIGVWGVGAVFLDWEHFPFTNFTSFPGSGDRFSADWHSAMCVVSQGDNLWVGTDGGGIHQYVNGRLKRSYTNIDGHPQSMHVTSAVRDSSGQLWFGAFEGGLYTIDPQSGKARYVPIEQGFMPDIRALSLVNGDSVLLCLASEGIYAVDTNSGQFIAKSPVDNSRSVARDPRGRYWVGTFTRGIVVYDASGAELQVLNTDTGLPSNSVRQLLMDDNGNMLCATSEGLLRFPKADTRRMETLSTGSGMPEGNSIQALAFDHERRLWGSSSHGIFCLRGDTAVAFNEATGVMSGGFFGASVDVASDGTISFGSLGGVCRFSPRELLDTLPPLTPIVASCTATGSGDTPPRQLATFGQVLSDTLYRLPYDVNTLQFTAAVPDFAYASGMQYQFWLEGFDSDWQTTGSSSVTYRNLPPGSYTLRLRARYHEQAWAQTTATIALRITPPWWLAWWAITIYCLIALALAALILRMVYGRLRAESRYRLEKQRRITQQEQNDERMAFYTNVSHELRTPLTLIRGPIDDALASDTLDSRDRQRFDIVSRNARQLQQLIDKILDFRRCETHHRQLYMQRLNVVPLLHGMATKWKEGLPANSRVSILTDIPQEHVPVNTDREALTTIINNLLSNALKYTQRGTVTLACHTSGATFTITVSDTGVGIAAKDLPRIFERYYRAAGAQPVGTGIGLALVKQLADLIGATLHTTSTLGKGTSIALSLPLAEDSASVFPLPSSTDPESRQRPLILLVDDNDDMRQYVKDIFQDLYDVALASDGAQGLAKARELIPDLIISDVMMPGIDGIALCRTLTSDILTSHIPVVLLTAKSQEADRQEGYSAGAHSYLTKPFTSQLLLQRVANILQERRRLAQRLTTHGTTTVCADTGTSTRPEQPTAKLRPVDQEFLQRLDRAIDDNLENDGADSAYLCDVMCMSRATLYRKIKALTELSPNEYVRSRRMDRARQLLLTGRYTVTEVAYKVGFSSPSYFRKCFKEQFGTLPSAVNSE